jgi:hypothetical protein
LESPVSKDGAGRQQFLLANATIAISRHRDVERPKGRILWVFCRGGDGFYPTRPMLNLPEKGVADYRT